MAGHNHNDHDELTGTQTTGHEWDGLKELNTPLPKWWLYTMYACIVWGLGYAVVMPAWPYITSQGWKATDGVLGYSQRGVVERELQGQAAARSGITQQIQQANLSDILAKPELLNAAIAGGKAAFADNCAGCHGSGAQGFVGFPNLQDDSWQWGGTIDEIHHTIAHGVRWDSDENTRSSMMPAFGKDGVLEAAQISQLTNFVLKVSGQKHDAQLAAAGTQLYADNCASCHGETAQGDVTQGAPSLADKVWLYGGSPEAIKAQIHSPRHGVMPAWSERLTPATIKSLAVYIYSLGGGQKAPVQSAEATPAVDEATPAAPAPVGSGG
jgi:cytochrome c oxidase cbb3-type subunit 3